MMDDARPAVPPLPHAGRSESYLRLFYHFHRQRHYNIDRGAMPASRRDISPASAARDFQKLRRCGHIAAALASAARL